jgi:GNAT superfamily N-acetyltransferase
MSGSATKLNFSISKPETNQDWEQIKEICCLAAAHPIEKSKQEDFSRKWIGPYRKNFPEWTYVIRVEDQIAGYLTGCPRNDNLPDDFFETEFRSLQLFSTESVERIKSDYPAHLHINFDPDFRGLGLGSKLIQRFSEDLRKGIHVTCGPVPVRFYKNNGFEEIECIQGIKNQPVYLLGLMTPTR